MCAMEIRQDSLRRGIDEDMRGRKKKSEGKPVKTQMIYASDRKMAMRGRE